MLPLLAAVEGVFTCCWAIWLALTRSSELLVLLEEVLLEERDGNGRSGTTTDMGTGVRKGVWEGVERRGSVRKGVAPLDALPGVPE